VDKAIRFCIHIRDIWVRTIRSGRCVWDMWDGAIGLHIHIVSVWTRL